MYILDDIAYAGKPKQSIKVIKAQPLDDYRLRLLFSTEETKIFDFREFLKSPAFSALKDKNIFYKINIDYGVPTWCGGKIDIAPEKLYEDGLVCDTGK